MVEPLVISIPPTSSQGGALRRIKPALGNASQSFPVLKVEQDPLQTVEALLHAIDASLQAFQLSFRGRVFPSDHLPFNDLGLLGHCQHSLS